MARAFLLIRPAIALVASLAAPVAIAGGPPGAPAPSVGNTFTMVVSAPAAGPRANAPSAGASLAPRTVVTNPYNVPLLQNAGSLRASR